MITALCGIGARMRQVLVFLMYIFYYGGYTIHDNEQENLGSLGFD